MLEALRADDFRNIYEFTIDGQPLTTVEGHLLREGRTFELDGRRYEIVGNFRRTRYEMTDHFGMVVAQAERVGRGRWTVTANGHTYEFGRPVRQLKDILSRLFARKGEELLIEDGQEVGSIRWLGHFLDTVADLPGMPVPVQVFAIVVMQSVWDSERSS
jgi:hypothetical protein